MNFKTLVPVKKPGPGGRVFNVKSKGQAIKGLGEAEREGSDKYRRILESAIRVFAQKGFHNTKVSEIADEAQVADGTIYLYFKNKDEILIKVFEESLSQIIRRCQEELEKIPDPIERIKRFIWFHLELLEENQALAEVLQVELRQSNKFMKEYLPSQWLAYLEIIANLIREGQKAGMIREEISPGIFKRALFGALDEISLHWVLTKKEKSYIRNSAEQLCQIFLYGVIKKQD